MSGAPSWEGLTGGSGQVPESGPGPERFNTAQVTDSSGEEGPHGRGGGRLEARVPVSRACAQEGWRTVLGCQ